MDKKDLENLTSGSETAGNLYKLLSSRRRHRWEPMQFSRIKRTLRKQFGNLDDKEFIRFFENLEAIGYGSIIKSSRGNPKAFKWSEPMTRLKSFLKELNTSKIAPAVKEGKTIIILSNNSNQIKIELPSNLDAKSKRLLADILLSS